MPPNPNYNHAPKVYSDELTTLGHGRAMWIPEPLEGIEVEISDVGFIEERMYDHRVELYLHNVLPFQLETSDAFSI